MVTTTKLGRDSCSYTPLFVQGVDCNLERIIFHSAALIMTELSHGRESARAGYAARVLVSRLRASLPGSFLCNPVESRTNAGRAVAKTAHALGRPLTFAHCKSRR